MSNTVPITVYWWAGHAVYITASGWVGRHGCVIIIIAQLLSVSIIITTEITASTVASATHSIYWYCTATGQSLHQVTVTIAHIRSHIYHSYWGNRGTSRPPIKMLLVQAHWFVLQNYEIKRMIKWMYMPIYYEHFLNRSNMARILKDHTVLTPRRLKLCDPIPNRSITCLNFQLQNIITLCLVLIALARVRWLSWVDLEADGWLHTAIIVA